MSASRDILRKSLAANGLPTTGTKADMLSRLQTTTHAVADRAPSLVPAYTTADDEQELTPIEQRMRVIKGLLKYNAQTTQSATREELERMKEQQDVWVEELKMINAQLEAIKRDRIMQLSVARLERGVSIMGIRP